MQELIKSLKEPFQTRSPEMPKAIAINFVKCLWTVEMVKKYREQEEKDLSDNKFAATTLSVLTRYWLLKDIATVVGTTEGTLRVWRTEESFKKISTEVSISLGRLLADTLDYIINEMKIDDDLYQNELKELYPGLNIKPPERTRTIYSEYPFMIGKDPLDGILLLRDYLGAKWYRLFWILGMTHTSHVGFDERIKQYIPKSLIKYSVVFNIDKKEEYSSVRGNDADKELTKQRIRFLIDQISNPQHRKKMKPDQIMAVGNHLKYAVDKYFYKSGI